VGFAYVRLGLRNRPLRMHLGGRQFGKIRVYKKLQCLFKFLTIPRNFLSPNVVIIAVTIFAICLAPTRYLQMLYIHVKFPSPEILTH
jgi:hypothetical protein